MTAGVNQQQTVPFNHRVLFFGGVVMRHRAVGVERGNGVEAQRHVIGTALTGSCQVFVNGQFGDAFASQCRVQPGEELAQRRAVLFHGLADMLGIRQAFLRFGQSGRIQAFDQLDAAAQVFQQTGRDPCRVDLQACSFWNSLQRRSHFAVIAQGHAILFKDCAQLGAHFTQRHEQRGLLLADQGEGNKHWVKRHIAATQVEQPGDVIEGGDEMPVGTTGLQGFTQLGELFATADGRLRRQVLIDRFIGQLRTVAPDIAQQVDVRAQSGAALFKLASQCPRRSHGHHRAIDRDNATLRSLFGQPFQWAGLTRLQFDQFDTATIELFGRLFPITAVRPNAGKVRSHDQGADRTMETRQPLASLPVTRQVFRQVRVGRRHQQGMNALPAHQFAGLRQALGHRSIDRKLRIHRVSC
ncbi:hypothetical protein D3C84_471980 [compost metagenome]